MTVVEVRQKNVTAAMVSLATTAVILLVMWYIVFGPVEGIGPGDNVGMEVNLGDSDYGSGNIQPMEPVGTDKPQEDEPEAAQSPNQDEEVSEVTPETSKPLVESKPLDAVTTSDEESPVEIKKDKPKEVKPTEKTVEKPKEKPEVKTPPVEKTVDKPKDKPAVKEEKKPVADINAVYKPGSSSKTDGKASDKAGKPGSQGDDIGKEGDKGVPGGTPGANEYKGTPGGGDGGGPVLDLKGWDWGNKPKPVISNDETGRIEFEIKVDENGELISYKKLSSGLSASSERACVEALRKLTFSRKGTGTPPKETVGRITFVVRAE